MIQHIQQTFACYPRQKINHTWLTFMTCLNNIIKHLGDSDDKIPHMNTEKFEHEARLPMVIDMMDVVASLMEALDVDKSNKSDTVDEDRDKDDNLGENNIELN